MECVEAAHIGSGQCACCNHWTAEIERLRIDLARAHEAIRDYFNSPPHLGHIEINLALKAALTPAPNWLNEKLREANAKKLREVADWFRWWKDMPADYARAAEALDRFADESLRESSKTAGAGGKP